MKRLLAFFVSGLALSSQELPPCDAPLEVRALALSAAVTDVNIPYAERREQARQQLDSLLAKHSRDISLHQRRIRWLAGAMAWDYKAPIADYLAHRNQHPGDPVFQFLYAKTLIGTQTPEAIGILESILQKYPGFAAAHLELAEIYSADTMRKDIPKSLVHREAFRKACPESVRGFSDSRQITNQEYYETNAARLRRLLEATPDNDQQRLLAYETLWSMEFRAVPASGYASVKERVRKDLQRLANLADPLPLPLLELLREGFQLTDGQAAAAAITQRIGAGFPNSAAAMRQAESDFRATNPYPSSGSVADIAAWRRKLRIAANGWIRLWPGAASPRRALFDALSGETLEEQFAAADSLLKNYSEQPDEFSSALPLHYSVASLYLRAKDRLDQIPALIQSGTDELVRQRDKGLAQDSLAKEKRTDYPYWIRFGHGVPILFTYHLQAANGEGARRNLWELEAYLQARANGEESTGQANQTLEALAWEMRARLAESEGRKADAVALYLRAESRQNGQPFSALPYRVNAGERAKVLWKELAGTAEGLRALGGNANPAEAAQSHWLQTRRSLPNFEITDTDGRVWRLSDLKNKRTFINLWATWCSWCQLELPELQRLYAEKKDEDGWVVISLNLDENPGLIQPFMKERGYTFPVLPALELFNRLSLEQTLPRNWIVGKDGQIAWEQTGYSTAAPPSEWLRKQGVQLLLALP